MKKVLTSLAIAALASIAPQGVLADLLSPQQAMSRVTRNTSSKFSNIASPEYVGKEFGDAAYYVFSMNGGGYMILSADDAAVPVLAVIDDGNFNYDALPSAVKDKLYGFAAEINQIRTSGGVTSREGGNKVSRIDIEPLMKTRWNQTSPYNAKCPVYNNAVTVTGAVGTAVAQVIRKYKYPQVGQNSILYQWQGDSIGMNFANYHPDYTHMPYGIYEGSEVADKDEVANLMYACGLATKTIWGAASIATHYAAATALINYFNYAPTVTPQRRIYYTYNEWVDLLYSAIAKGEPVIYTATGTSGSHTFVCDGYMEGDLFHINWGWGGVSDGYFRMSALNPDVIGQSGGAGRYNTNELAIVGIRPNFDGAEFTPIVGTELTPQMSYAYVGGKHKFALTGGFGNYSNRDLNVKLAFEMRDKNGNTTLIGDNANPLDLWMSYSNVGITRETSVRPDTGTYKIRPIFAYKKADGSFSDWLPMSVSATVPKEFTFHASIENNTYEAYIVQNEEQPALTATEVKPLTKVAPNTNFKLSALLHNPGRFEAFRSTYVAVFGQDGTRLFLSPVNYVSVPAGKDFTLETTCKLPTSFVAGNYTMAILSENVIGTKNYIEISQRTPLEVVDKPADIKMQVLSMTVDNPEDVNPSQVTLNLKLKCTEGFYANYIDLWTKEKGGSAWLKPSIKTGNIYLNEGDTIDMKYVFTNPFAVAGKEYQLSAYFVPASGSGFGTLATIYYKVGPLSGINSITDNNEYSISPNPSTSEAIVSAPAAIRNIMVFNMAGNRQNVEVQLNGQEATLNVSSLPAGIYLVTINTDNTSKTLRLIKK